MGGMFGDRSRVVVMNGQPVQEQQPQQSQPAVAQERQDFADIMEALAREDAAKVSAIREALGITQSRTTPFGAKPVTAAPETSLRPQARPEAPTESLRPVARPEPVQPIDAPQAMTTAPMSLNFGIVDQAPQAPAPAEAAPTMPRRPEMQEPSAQTEPTQTATSDVNFLETKTFKLLEGVEGFKKTPYSLNDKPTINGKPHRSGLTVGAGIDFGQHTRASLEKIGLPKTMIDKAENAGWIGLNPDTIIDPVTKKPAATRERGHALMYEKFKAQKKSGELPVFTEEELNVATPIMYKPYEDSARKQVDARFGEGTYDSLDESSKAVLTLEKYHRGATYTLPDAMIEGAVSGNPLKAAEGISWSSRRKNMKDWLRKLKMIPSGAPATSLRPQPRPSESQQTQSQTATPADPNALGMIGGVKDDKNVWQSFDGSGMAHSADYKDYSQLFREYTTEQKEGYVPVGEMNGQTVYASPDYAKDENGNYISVNKDEAVALAAERGSILPTREMVKELYAKSTRIPMAIQPIGETGGTGDTALYTQKINEAVAQRGVKPGQSIVHGKEFFLAK